MTITDRLNAQVARSTGGGAAAGEGRRGRLGSGGRSFDEGLEERLLIGCAGNLCSQAQGAYRYPGTAPLALRGEGVNDLDFSGLRVMEW